MSNKIAHIVIGDNYAHVDPDHLKSPNYQLPMPYDSDSIKITIDILQKKKYDIKLITWEEYSRNVNTNYELIIVAQWPLIRTNWDMSSLINFRKRVNTSIENGCNFILMHGFYPEYPFMKLLNIDYYENPVKTSPNHFQNKRSFKVINNHTDLMKNVAEFIDTHKAGFRSDEFIYIMKEDSSFITLIEKIPLKGTKERYISFGYLKMQYNNHIFLIDIHNIGKVKTHAEYFTLLLNNSLEYIET